MRLPKLPKHWFGRLLLWWWRKRHNCTRFEFEYPASPRPRSRDLQPPPELLAIFDNRRHYVAVFDLAGPEHWLVLRMTTRASMFDVVHRALLNVHEPNGRVQFRQLPVTLQRDLLTRFGEFRHTRTA